LGRETSGARSKYPQTFVQSLLEPPSIGCAASFWKCAKRMAPATFLTLYTTLFVVSCVTYVKTDKLTSQYLFRDGGFASFRQTLDAEMKRLKRTGAGSSKRQAEPLTAAEEELLWQKGVLGDHSPLALLNTVFYFNGMCFALRSGEEHRRLRFENSQVVVVRKPGERAYLQYTEDSSKNNQGGLDSRIGSARQSKLFTMRTQTIPLDVPFECWSDTTASVLLTVLEIHSICSH